MPRNLDAICSRRLAEAAPPERPANPLNADLEEPVGLSVSQAGSELEVSEMRHGLRRIFNQQTYDVDFVTKLQHKL